MRTRSLVRAGALVCLSAAAAHAAQAVLVARTGSQAPALPGSTPVFLGAPVSNADGDVAFYAQLTGGGVTSADDGVVYAGAPGAPSIAARDGATAPGTGGTFGLLVFDLGLRDSDVVIVRGSVAGATPDEDGGVWTGTAGALALVAREGAVLGGAPGPLSADTFFPDIVAGLPTCDDSGATAFRALVTGVGATGDELLFAGAPGALVPVAREGDVAPGAGGATFVASPSGETFPAPAIAASGDVLFYGRLAGAAIDTTNNAGYWSGPPSGPQLRVRVGDAVPAAGAGRRLRGLSAMPTWNASGTLLFDATTVDADGLAAQQALLVGTPGALGLVALQGALAPQDPEGLAFQSTLSPSRLNAAGDVAFRAILLDAQFRNRAAVYADTGSGLRLLARDGSQAPGLPAGVVHVQPASTSLFLGEGGHVAFDGTVAGPNVVVGVNDQCLWLVDPDGTVRLIARTGDAVQVGAETLTFASLALYGGKNAGDAGAGRSGPLDATGALAFRAEFGDGSSAILVATDLVTSAAPLPGGGGGGGCDDVPSCLAALTAALPSPAAAPKGKARRVAKSLARLASRTAKAVGKATNTAKPNVAAKQYRKARAKLVKLLAKAEAADAAGTLGVLYGDLRAPADTLLALLP